MVGYFSVDWLAQSHRIGAPPEDRGAGPDPAPTSRPHVPCVVQPFPPTFGRSSLQPKPKASKPAKDAEPPAESSAPQDSGRGSSPVHPPSCASPMSEVGGDSSGYESEAASSECLSVDEGSDAERDGPQRRARTKFTPEQISRLEKVFNKHRYLDAGDRVKTAQKLDLTETQVRTWFQNRRMKLKREAQDFLAPQVPPLMFRPLLPVQYHSLAGQRPHYPAPAPAFYPHPVPQLVPQLVLQQHVHPHHPPHRVIHQPFY